MPDIAAALKQYGFVGQLANSIPELRSILSRAAGANWSADEFSRALQDSNWWRNSADAVKQYQLLKVTKPGEFANQRTQLIGKVKTIANEMGVGIPAGSPLAHIVDTAQMMGWDEATLRQHIGNSLGVGGIKSGATYGGQAGQIQQQLRTAYYDMGIPYSGYRINMDVRYILSGKSTVEATQSRLINQAVSAFPALAEQIRAGETVRQIADPYIQTKAQLLEVPPDTVTLQDQTVRQGLSHRDAQGKIGLMPLWQYEQQVKADPKWDKTKNARDAYSAMAHQIGRDWGFTS